MTFCKMMYFLRTLGILSVFLNPSQATEIFIQIPVSISPLVQPAWIEMSRSVSFFYKTDRNFYSKVTPLDVAKNENQEISEIIKKPISVVFLIAASSRISQILTREKLIYDTGSSKWSYKIPVKKLISESDGTVTKLTDTMKIYKLQELAMRVLARKYELSVDSILQKHGMNQMELYAADEEQWIKIVGTITDIVIKKRSNEMNLTPCYLAELINKTESETQGFTLQEVDIYLNNKSKLNKKLPVYRDSTLRSFYQEFNMTPTQLAKISNTNLTVLKAIGVKNLIQLFTRTILSKLEINKMPSSFSENETICPSQWSTFKDAVLLEAFENQAKKMSITPAILANLIKMPYNNIKTLSVMKMINLIELAINPIKEDKRKTEKFTLSMLRKINSTKRLNTKKHNAISLIKRTTKFGKYAFKLLYGWAPRDYHFARLFSAEEIGDVCLIDINKKTLLSLAKINMGKNSEDINCTAFLALRSVWGQASLSDLKNLYYPNTRISLSEPIATVLGKLTNSSEKISCRVLSKTPIIQWLLQKVTLNNMSEMTNHTDDYLQEIPIQRIVLMIYELLNTGAFDSLIRTSYH
ncbi:uncharacterized protein LOC114521914 isoform X2 [Dendronephthya gigantea]|uniref:uncharacterized protein LOC114521914 isoform X2 n=1 Tax=Dendronephthya gigantea TaxID=151771 RepID=UPI00106CECE5|nr:uncharacterized protein LOC114521914 isoform X2 [Dendronephthya gigantea]